MIRTNLYKSLKITNNLYRLGTPSFPVYLSLGKDGMIIEGGISAIFPIILEQIEELGIEVERIKYLALTHTHADHVGAVPHIKKHWPHVKVIAGTTAAGILKNESAVKAAIKMDRTLTHMLLVKHAIAEQPPEVEDHHFKVDLVVKENDRIDLGNGIIWTVYDTPGHSSCHTSYFEVSEKVVSIGDATGFYVPETGVFWPNYFESLENYCRSIWKLYSLTPRRGLLSHNHILQDAVGPYLRKALKATADYHGEMLERLARGETTEKIALEKAKWVNTLTADHPYEIMVSLSKVLVKRSYEAANRSVPFTLFDSPYNLE